MMLFQVNRLLSWNNTISRDVLLLLQASTHGCFIGLRRLRILNMRTDADDRCTCTAEFLKSTRASGLLQVTRVTPAFFCVKACPQDLLVLICRVMLILR